MTFFSVCKSEFPLFSRAVKPDLTTQDTPFGARNGEGATMPQSENVAPANASSNTSSSSSSSAYSKLIENLPTPKKMVTHPYLFVVGEELAMCTLAVQAYNHYKRVHHANMLKVEKEKEKERDATANMDDFRTFNRAAYRQLILPINSTCQT